MGFVYNNTWEGFCKSYFELHGYFVTTNLFAALVRPEDVYLLDHEGLIDTDETAEKSDARSSKIEADLVAYRLPATNLGKYPLDKRRKGASESEFFAGDPRYTLGDQTFEQQLVYAEVRANLSTTSPQQQVKKFFAKGKDARERRKVERMTEILEQRFGMTPLVVVMAYDINAECRNLFEDHGEWKYKEFPSMLRFMRRRMKKMFNAKKRVQYNDPFLELLRYFEREKRRK